MPLSRHAAIGLRDVHIAEIGRGRLEAGGKALLLDMHVVGVEVDEDVVRADPLDDPCGIAAAVDQMRLVAVAGLDAELQAIATSPALRGAFEEAADAVDLLAASAPRPVVLPIVP